MRLLTTLLAFSITIAALSQGSGTSNFFAEGKKAKEQKNYVLAVEQFKKAAAQTPTDGEAWYELGWCYNELEKYDEAAKALANAKTYLKDQARVYFESGYANDMINKIETAIADYKKCIELDQYYSGAYRQLANIYFTVDKDYKTAYSYYNQYVNLSREADISARTWYRKGYCENETAQYEDAVMSLKKAIGMDNKYAAAYDELGYAYYILEKADEAIDAYSNSKNLDPKSSTPCEGMGDVYRLLKKDVDGALKNYSDAIALNPNSGLSNYGMGWCYNEKGNYDAAIPYLKKAVELNNKYAAAYTELGYAYYALKRYDEALAELNRSVNLQNASSPNYYIGLCYIGKNQKVKAQEVYKKLVGINAGDADALLKKINAMK